MLLFFVSLKLSKADVVGLHRDLVSSSEKLKADIALELKGKNLSCWCKIGEPCHADFLLEIANAE